MTSQPVRRRGPYRNGARTKSQIVEAAARVFGEFGFAGGSLRQIADQVGVSPASLLQHFGSKEGLLTAVLEEWGAETHRIATGIHTGIDFFVVFLKELMRYHVDHRGLIELFLTMAAESTSDSHPAQAFMRHRYQRSLGRFRDNLVAAQRAGDVRPMTAAQVEVEVRALIAVMDGLELQWLLDREMDLVSMFDAHLDATVARWGHAGR